MAEITNVSKLIINYLTEEQYQTAKASGLINENELYIESAQRLLGVAHPTSLPASGGNADTVGGFTVGVNVPANAKFTDTVYSHPTSAGNKHIPTGGASGQVLKYSASGTATWQTDKDTVTTINGKTGAISKADIVALGIPAQDTVYTHPSTHPASMITDLPTGKKVARFVVGTSTAGWTAADCDYLCDGTADQTEINAAITALPATGGEIVILDGTYNIAAKIDVTKDNVSIRGNGNATILKRMFNSSVTEGVITLTSRSGCKISNLQIKGNKTSYTNSNNYSISLTGSSRNSTVIGNTCNSNSSAGIYLDYLSSNNTVIGNTCNNNNGYGIYLDSSGDNTVIGNTCNSNSSAGIYLRSSSSNNTVTGNTCYYNNGHGIRLDSSSNNTVTGNTCYSNSSAGIYVDSSRNSTVIGNTCNSNSSAGIRLDSSSNNTVTGNTCYSNSSAGIYLDYSSNNNTVIGNTCIRGTGLSTDYTASQYTIRLQGKGNSYNLIAMNNCMGKAVTNGGGTGNTLVNNKFDAS